MIYQPGAFVGIDLDRHRLSLDGEDQARFADAQKAIAEGTTDPAFVRYRRARLDADRTLEGKGIDTDGPEAVAVRVDIRDGLHSFEALEGRPPNGEDIAAIVAEAIDRSVGDGPPATRAPDGAFDPSNIILAQAGGGGSRGGGGGGSGRGPQTPPATTPQRQPAPGPGPNQPPREIPDGFPTAVDKVRRWLQPPVQPPAASTPPDAAGPRAAAEQGAGPTAEPPKDEEKPRSFGAIERALEEAVPAESDAFHYTFDAAKESILKTGLKRGSYLTTTGELSPLQAHIDLALSPNRGLPGAVLRIDLNGLRSAGYEIPKPTQVGRSNNMPGAVTKCVSHIQSTLSSLR